LLEFHPLTPPRWPDLVQLFQGHGNPGYCWCTTWRLSSSAYHCLDSAGRKAVLQDLVQGGIPTGIIAYTDGEPAGWCSVAPRQTYVRLERSRTIQPIDELITWCVMCFFVARPRRGQGLALGLLQASVAYARSQGAQAVEGYPVEPRIDDNRQLQPATSYNFMGYLSTFQKAGFQDVTPPGQARRVMRIVFFKT
jgi:GNAT superfamily N-acetyltransferase